MSYRASKSRDVPGTACQDRVSGMLQRKCACGQRTIAGGQCDSCKSNAGAETHVDRVLASPGRPLDADTRGFMEQWFGQNFSRVRTHADSEAGVSARRLSALAYTVGNHIAFAPGEYRPGTFEGRSLLAHELTHAVQQASRGERIVQRQPADGPGAGTSDTAASVFPYAKGAVVSLSQLFPDALFGFAPNNVSNWVHGRADQDLTISEATADRVRAAFSGPVKQAVPGGAAAAGIPDVSIIIDRIGAGRFQINIDSGAKRLTSQEVRAARDDAGATSLTPVTAKAKPLPSADNPPSKADEIAKSDGASPPGLVGASKPDADKAVLDSMSKPVQTQDDLDAEDRDKVKRALKRAGEAFLKTAEGKRLTDAASKEADKLPTAVLVGVPTALVAAALAGLAATKTESPINETPDIPLGKIGGVEMKFKVVYEGPVNKPTKASLTLTFAKGSLEVAPSFTATWRDPGKPASAENATGLQGGLSVKIPLGKDPEKTKEPTDAEKTRAEVARLREEDARFRKGMTFKPGTPEAKEAELEKKAEQKAIQDSFRKQFEPGPATPPAGAWSSPRILDNFDMKPGPAKTTWNLGAIGKLVTAGLAASPGAILQVVAIFDALPGDTDEDRRLNADHSPDPAMNADTVKSALEQWFPPTKGRIRTAVEFKGGGRNFGLPADAAAALGTHDVAIIFIPGSGAK